MKKFKEYIKEDPNLYYAEKGEGVIDINNSNVRATLNSLLGMATSGRFVTPYIPFMKASRLLAKYSIILPQTILMGQSGRKVFNIDQFGLKIGMKDDGKVVTKDQSDYKVFFEYKLNEDGMYEIYCEVIDQDDIDEINLDEAKLASPETGKKKIFGSRGSKPDKKNYDEKIGDVEEPAAKSSKPYKISYADVRKVIKRKEAISEATLQTQPKPSPNLRPTPRVATAYSPQSNDPTNKNIEGGLKDAVGKPINTLTDYVKNGKPVTVAVDKQSQNFNKPGSLDTGKDGFKFNQVDKNAEGGVVPTTVFHPQGIPVKASDTGSAFKGKGESRVDIPVDKDLPSDTLNKQPFSNKEVNINFDKNKQTASALDENRGSFSTMVAMLNESNKELKLDTKRSSFSKMLDGIGNKGK